MKVVQINATCGVGSTGRICVGISQLLTEKQIENYILYSAAGNGYALGIPCADPRYIRRQALQSKILGNYGFNSRRATRTMIEALDRIGPDIVHLHNIHGHDCDLEALFSYFKERKIRLVWTFHDCWAFTGYCTYFDMAGCSQWQTQCADCVQRRQYSWFADRSAHLFAKKKALFSGLDLTIVTPSAWLADVVKQSFLRSYPVQVIRNGLDLRVFQPTKSGFRAKYGLEKTKIVLGVALGWDKRKGLDVFVEMAERLPEEYGIVLVGVDKNTAKRLPPRILTVARTNSRTELAELYSAADVFVNPTREENYPTVNMEALACGVPVVTFRTGGSSEMLDGTCGSVVEKNDTDALAREIVRICSERPYSAEQCVQKAAAFDQNERYKEYVKLYERIDTAGNTGDFTGNSEGI